LPTARPASATPPDGPKPPAAAEPRTAAAAAQKAPSPGGQKAPAVDDEKATAVVEKQLVNPLAEKEAKRSRFSRGYIPPQARRVRIPDGARSTDGRGAAFVAFSVDERSGVIVRKARDDAESWRKDAIVGCVYPAQGEVFIKRGDKFFAAALLLGQKTPAADDAVCRPAEARLPAGAPAAAAPAT
jgi:hypothetical protein